MKVLWITNIPIGKIAAELFNKPMGGLWMDAMLKGLEDSPNLAMTIVTTAEVKNTICKTYDGVNYYLLPGGLPTNYNRNRNKAHEEWEQVLLAEKPDLIQVWGTEYSHSIPALEVAKEQGIPSVVYIQGILTAISRYADGLLPQRQMLKYITLRDIYRKQVLAFRDRWYYKRAIKEKRIIELSGSVIVENDWAEFFCKSINPNLGIYRIPLNINEVFFDKEWSISNIEKYSIMSNASGPAYKGIHELLKALLIIREKYPEVKLYIPGRSIVEKRSFINRQKVSGYWNFLSDYVRKHDLAKNIEFTGYLTQEQLSQKLSQTHVFVLASAIENHSSSLKEAMAVGTPAVASQVGGVPEYFAHGYCGYTYRYGEAECIAGYVCRLFENEELCQQFSQRSRKKVREVKNDDITGMVLEMYHNIIS